MAVKKKAKKTVKGETHLKAVDSAIASINDVAAAATKAVIATGKEYSKLEKTAKSMNKKRVSLMKKVKTAAKRLKKDANVANKKAVNIKIVSKVLEEKLAELADIIPNNVMNILDETYEEYPVESIRRLKQIISTNDSGRHA